MAEDKMEDKKSGKAVQHLQKLYAISPDRAYSQYKAMSDDEKGRVKLAMPVDFEEEFMTEMNRPQMSQGYVQPAGTEAGEQERQAARMAKGDITPMETMDMAIGLLAAMGGKKVSGSRRAAIASMRHGYVGKGKPKGGSYKQKEAETHRSDEPMTVGPEAPSKSRSEAENQEHFYQTMKDIDANEKASGQTREMSWRGNFRGELDKEIVDRHLELNRREEAARDTLSMLNIKRKHEGLSPLTDERSIRLPGDGDMSYIPDPVSGHTSPKDTQLYSRMMAIRRLDRIVSELPPERIKQLKGFLSHEKIRFRDKPGWVDMLTGVYSGGATEGPAYEAARAKARVVHGLNPDGSMNKTDEAYRTEVHRLIDKIESKGGRTDMSQPPESKSGQQTEKYDIVPERTGKTAMSDSIDAIARNFELISEGKPSEKMEPTSVAHNLHDFYGDSMPAVVRRINEKRAATGMEPLTVGLLNTPIQLKVTLTDKAFDMFTGEKLDKNHGEGHMTSYRRPDGTYSMTVEVFATPGKSPPTREEIKSIIDHEIWHGAQRDVLTAEAKDNTGHKQGILPKVIDKISAGEADRTYLKNWHETDTFIHQPILRFIERMVNEKSGRILNENTALQALKDIRASADRPTDEPHRQAYEQMKYELQRALMGRDSPKAMIELLDEYINNPMALKHLLRVGQAVDSKASQPA